MKEHRCLTCGEADPEQFYVVRGYVRKEQCKSCFNESQKAKWKNNKLRAIELKGGKCQHCGYDKYHGALEFHHIDPSVKESNWDKKWSRSWKTILESLKHTILLCANCHREEHEKIRQTTLSP